MTCGYIVNSLKRIGQHASDMERGPLAAVGDLVAAARPVGDDQRVLACVPDDRELRHFRHRERYLEVFGFVTESPGHAAAA